MPSSDHARNIWNGIHATYDRLRKKPTSGGVTDSPQDVEPPQRYLAETRWRIPVIEKNDDQLYDELCYCVFNAGIKRDLLESRWSGIKKAFADFRVDEVAVFPADRVEVILADPAVLRNRWKITGCLRNAVRVQELRREWGSFANYLMEYAQKHGPVGLVTDVQDRFVGIGPATGPQFLKDLGFEMFFKADAHVRNILHRTGLVPAKKATIDEVGSAMNALREAENERTGRTTAQVVDIDWILFSYGTGEGLEHAICRPYKPLCTECGASESCPKNGIE